MLQSMRSVAKYIWIVIIAAFVVGFLLFDTSGLIGSQSITPTTAIGEVDGEEITYQAWYNTYQRLAQEQQDQLGRALTLDEQRAIEKAAFDQIVQDILLRQEYERRGITVSDEEIIAAAQYLPPPELMEAPDFQTEGRFDPEKYQRFLRSPLAKQQGLLAYLEAYYRSELPKQKLLEQVASGVYLTDQELWRIYQDQHDSARVSYVALTPDMVADASVRVTDDEIRRYFEAHRSEFERPGRAVVSVLTIPRVITAADTAATRERVLRLREEIVSGQSTFADVARRESIDSASAVQGGLLPAGGRGRFVEPFERAAYALRPGEVSQPVLTQFGYHLIRLESRSGDSLTLRHILVPIRQSEASATATDRLADSLAGLAAEAEDPKRFDAAAAQLGLRPRRADVVENQPLTIGREYIPSVSAWAFGGARVGETSELFDDENGYYIARLEELRPGGEPKLERVRDDVRAAVLRRKKLEALEPRARQIAQAAAAASLEQAAQQAGLAVNRTPWFNRVSDVPGLGRLNRAIGAAFGLPVGAVGAPIVTDDAVFVLRVDERSLASRQAFEEQKQVLGQMVMQQLRQQRVQELVENLRRGAKVEDRRDILNAARDAEI